MVFGGMDGIQVDTAELDPARGEGVGFVECDGDEWATGGVTIRGIAEGALECGEGGAVVGPGDGEAEPVEGEETGRSSCGSRCLAFFLSLFHERKLEVVGRKREGMEGGVGGS